MLLRVVFFYVVAVFCWMFWWNLGWFVWTFLKKKTLLCSHGAAGHRSAVMISEVLSYWSDTGTMLVAWACHTNTTGVLLIWDSGRSITWDLSYSVSKKKKIQTDWFLCSFDTFTQWCSLLARRVPHPPVFAADSEVRRDGSDCCWLRPLSPDWLLLHIRGVWNDMLYTLADLIGWKLTVWTRPTGGGCQEGGRFFLLVHTRATAWHYLAVLLLWDPTSPSCRSRTFSSDSCTNTGDDVRTHHTAMFTVLVFCVTASLDKTPV